MSQNNRLSGNLPKEFASPWIDPAKPIRFKVDELTVRGFAGDTVLSALLASGVTRAGRLQGRPVALDPHSAPNIALAGAQGQRDAAVPMAMCPAIDGAHYTVVGKKPPLAPALKVWRTLARRPQDLRGDLARADAVAEPWADRPADRVQSAQVIIVGAGVAGLSAALEAARLKARVIVIEREARAGGLSVYFGKAEDEPAPDALLAELIEKAENDPAITLLTSTAAFALEGTRVKAIRVASEDGAVRSQRLDFEGDRVILATGAAERLPIFPGNRLPGVMLASFAWQLAARYNVWPGRKTHIHTGTNAGYRMALLGSEAGIEIKRVSDPRYSPQTRFIEFCKAYGFRLSWGLAVDTATFADGRGRMLSLHHCDSRTGRWIEEGLAVQQIIVSGGWQRDLDLWMRGGGAVAWDEERGQLVPVGRLGGVEIAGSAAGYQSLAGCRDDGAASARRSLIGADEHPADHLIDEMFETPDTSLPVSTPRRRGLEPAYASPSGTHLLPEPRRTGWFGRRDESTPRTPLRAQNQLDVVGLVATGDLEARNVTAFCAERCILPLTIMPSIPEPSPTSEEMPAIPDYLDGRFGPGQAVWRLAPGEARRLDPGCLVFPNTDETDPRAALGVVIGPPRRRSTRILLADAGLAPGDAVYIRDGLTCVSAVLGEKVSGE